MIRGKQTRSAPHKLAEAKHEASLRRLELDLINAACIVEVSSEDWAAAPIDEEPSNHKAAEALDRWVATAIDIAKDYARDLRASGLSEQEIWRETRQFLRDHSAISLETRLAREGEIVLGLPSRRHLETIDRTIESEIRLQEARAGSSKVEDAFTKRPSVAEREEALQIVREASRRPSGRVKRETVRRALGYASTRSVTAYNNLKGITHKLVFVGHGEVDASSVLRVAREREQRLEIASGLTDEEDEKDKP